MELREEDCIGTKKIASGKGKTSPCNSTTLKYCNSVHTKGAQGQCEHSSPNQLGASGPVHLLLIDFAMMQGDDRIRRHAQDANDLSSHVDSCIDIR